MPDPDTLPNWFDSVKAAMSGVPIPVWLGILLAESGGNPEASNTTLPDDSHGLFQLNRRGGQGAGWSIEALHNPALNANIARPAIKRGYDAAYQAMVEIPLSALPMADIAIDSGHPGQDAGKSRQEMREDSRIRRIVAIYEAAQAAHVQSGGSDTAVWKAAVLAYNGGAESDTTLPLPGLPGQSDIPAAVAGGADVVADALGINKLLKAIQEQKAYIALYVIALLLVLIGVAGLIFGRG